MRRGPTTTTTCRRDPSVIHPPEASLFRTESSHAGSGDDWIRKGPDYSCNAGDTSSYRLGCLCHCDSGGSTVGRYRGLCHFGGDRLSLGQTRTRGRERVRSLQGLYYFDIS